MWIAFLEFLEFIIVLSLSLILTLVVFFKKIICLILKKVLVRIGFVYYSNHTYVSRSVDIICYRNYYNCCLKSDCNSINYFTSFWACSKYVKTRENWLITIVAFVVYGVGTYMYIQFAFRGY